MWAFHEQLPVYVFFFRLNHKSHCLHPRHAVNSVRIRSLFFKAQGGATSEILNGKLEVQRVRSTKNHLLWSFLCKPPTSGIHFMDHLLWSLNQVCIHREREQEPFNQFENVSSFPLKTVKQFAFNLFQLLIDYLNIESIKQLRKVLHSLAFLSSISCGKIKLKRKRKFLSVYEPCIRAQ